MNKEKAIHQQEINSEIWPVTTIQVARKKSYADCLLICQLIFNGTKTIWILNIPFYFVPFEHQKLLYTFNLFCVCSIKLWFVRYTMCICINTVLCFDTDRQCLYAQLMLLLLSWKKTVMQFPRSKKKIQWAWAYSTFMVRFSFRKRVSNLIKNSDIY